jgi:inosine/guanosine/xanthosine phosphorylase family protein
VSGVARPTEDRSAEAAAAVSERSGARPRVALVLGSGLGSAIGPGAMISEAEVPYAEIPGFPPPSVPGHAARLTLGSLFGVPAAVFSGRVHFYEGHGMAGPTLIPRLSAALGARVLILTNAAGGLDADMRAGDLMLLTDHVNLMGANPLTGWRFGDGTPAFVDLSNVYDPSLRAAALAVAEREGIHLRTGVYAAFPGPSYETPAEHAMARGMGANAVGMSTVPEAVAAAALGLRTLAISCITNVVGQPTTHQEVLAAATGASATLARLVAGILEAIPAEDGQAG